MRGPPPRPTQGGDIGGAEDLRAHHRIPIHRLGQLMQGGGRVSRDDMAARAVARTRESGEASGEVLRGRRHGRIGLDRLTQRAHGGDEEMRERERHGPAELQDAAP